MTSLASAIAQKIYCAGGTFKSTNFSTTVGTKRVPAGQALSTPYLYKKMPGTKCPCVPLTDTRLGTGYHSQLQRSFEQWNGRVTISCALANFRSSKPLVNIYLYDLSCRRSKTYKKKKKGKTDSDGVSQTAVVKSFKIKCKKREGPS